MWTNGLYSLIAANAPIAALIAGRLYPVTLPKSPTLPALTYQIVSQVNVGEMGSTEGMQRARVQFDAFAADYYDATALRQALRVFFRALPLALADGTVIQNSSQIQTVDYYDDDAQIYRCMAEFYLWFDNAF